MRKLAFSNNFHTRKLGEFTVYFVVCKAQVYEMVQNKILMFSSQRQVAFLNLGPGNLIIALLYDCKKRIS